MRSPAVRRPTGDAVVGWHVADACLWAKAVATPLRIRLAAAVGGDGWATVGPLVFLALLITIGACIVAFFAWFVKHNCGE